MSSLLRHLSPLAPDDSGACSVFYELGGITVICDAGGCAGNVCGFDEPRWHEKQSALFSAGLRDMDAILGRDKLLIDKLAQITEQIPAEFTAIVGTPVPAVIATDFSALKRMAEKKTGLPCITVPTDGTKYYDSGAEQAYYAVFDAFATEQYPVKENKTGILGATPLDTGFTRAADVTQGMQDGETVCFGLDSGLEEIRRASECALIQVIAPSGLKTAKLLKERFGTPYVIRPQIPGEVLEKCRETGIGDKRILIIHQQFAANQLRELLNSQAEDQPVPAQTDCATWFQFHQDYAQENDFRIRTEPAQAEAPAQETICGKLPRAITSSSQIKCCGGRCAASGASGSTFRITRSADRRCGDAVAERDLRIAALCAAA